jgi:putative ATP-dependent endonuclease of the OLD family
MARIRKIEVSHFRCIRELVWCPRPGINCLIGQGDSGKSSILDAIDLCLGARRNIQFTDADFYQLNVGTPVAILVTLGELDDELKSLESYGNYLRGFDARTGGIEDEPDASTETVMTVKLTVSSDLEPSWSLVSERAEIQGLTRNLSWGDRARIAPTRLGIMADYHLGWRRGSVLNRISPERADASAALAKAARDARAAFGEEVQGQLGETLAVVATTARELGIPIGDNIKAMLDAHSVSFSGGTISLHDEDGIPLRGLGVGSTRLLIAGLQRKAAPQSPITLIDELEYGLEPHRIIRFLGSLGAKEKTPPLQVFMTTHSPVALRELAGSQLFVLRGAAAKHNVMLVGTAHETQSTIRLYPEAFLARSVIVCEGASEVGLIRGLDHYQVGNGATAVTACGTALADCGGGDVDRPYLRASAFRALGYRAAVVRDDDKKPAAEVEAAFIADGGKVVAWRDGRALEDELFLSLTDEGVEKLIDRAVQLHGEAVVNEHVKSASLNAKNLNAVRTEQLTSGFTLESRQILGKAARARRAGWFKSVTSMEDVAREIIGPDLERADPGFKALIDDILEWARDAGG